MFCTACERAETELFGSVGSYEPFVLALDICVDNDDNVHLRI